MVSDGDYQLLPDYGAIFDLNNENNEEIIFDVQSIRQSGLGIWVPHHTHPRGDPGYSRTWSGINSELPFYNSFSEEDARKEVTFVTEYVTDGKTYKYDQNNLTGDDFQNDAPPIGKMLDCEQQNLDGCESTSIYTERNYIILRYADVFLMLAEAFNEENSGPTPEAYAAINEVRSRANLPDLTPGLSYEQFEDSVLVDMQKELVFESNLWADAQRNFRFFKQKVEEHSRIGAASTFSIAPPVEITVEDPKHRLFPFPQRAIDTNTEITEEDQNPGW